MEVGTTRGSITDITGSLSGNLLYLSHSDSEVLIEQWNSIMGEKKIINAYSIGNKHVLVIATAYKIKKVTKNRSN